MAVMGRDKGEILYDADKRDVQESPVEYADSRVVLELANEIARDNAELMHRLA